MRKKSSNGNFLVENGGNKMKQAILIVAHNNWSILEASLEYYDRELFDIYLHIDKKKEVDFKNFFGKRKDVRLVKNYNVNWGAYSMIKAEISLFTAAYEDTERYSYYHLISGVDFPLKNSEKLFNFFDKNYPKNFIEFSCHEESFFSTHEEYIKFLRNFCGKPYLNRLKYYHLFQEIDKISRTNLYNGIEKVAIVIQKLLFIDRTKNTKVVYGKGSNWGSFTDDFVKLLLSEKDKKVFKETYEFTLCADEIYKQTLFLNSSLINTLYFDNKTKLPNNMRRIDWERGRPYTFTNKDFFEIKELSKSDYMFIRKLDSVSSNKVITFLNNNRVGD